LRIALDGNPLLTQTQRGIGKTTRRLIEEFARRSNPFDIFCYVPGSAWQRPPHWRHVFLRRLAPGESLPSAAARDGASLVHLMDYFFPLYDPAEVAAATQRPFRLVVTVRDIIPLHFPREKKAGLGRLRRNLFPILGAVDLIIAISQATREDLIRHLDVPGEKIEVVHHGVDLEVFHDRFTAEEVEDVRRRYKLPARYIVYVSAFDPRKNHHLLLNAYHTFLRMTGTDCALVLVGPGRLPATLVSHIRKLNLQERVIVLHGLPVRDLALVYRGATLSAFPSLYEGFGNPLLEGMACGTPTVALAKASVPEVAGDGALLVEENDHTAFAGAMARVLQDPDLSRDLGERGRRRAERFTWTAAAQKTLAIYERLVSS